MSVWLEPIVYLQVDSKYRGDRERMWAGLEKDSRAYTAREIAPATFGDGSNDRMWQSRDIVLAKRDGKRRVIRAAEPTPGE